MILKGKKILITGGAGFIGSHLVEKLIGQNQIIIYDNFHRNALKYTKLANHPRVKIIEGDILDTRRLNEAVDKVDIVIHLAAIAGVESVIVTPLETLDINLMGTYNLLKAINGKSKKIQKFIFIQLPRCMAPSFIKQRKKE